MQRTDEVRPDLPVAPVKAPCDRGLVPCRGDSVSTTRDGDRLTITWAVRSDGWSQCIVYGPTVKFTAGVRI